MLFVCRQNAGRSQMAEALFTAKAAPRAVGKSAGSEPARAVHPVVVEAMAEVGIDLADRVPLHVGTLEAATFDAVVTMGCGDDCPFFPGARYFDWDLADPSDLTLAEVRTIRDSVSDQVDGLVEELFG